MTAILVAEVLGRRVAAEGLLAKLEGWLPVAEEPAVPAEGTTFVPVSNFGEKRVHAITKKTVVKVVKAIEVVKDVPTPVPAPAVREGVEFAYKIS